MTARVVTCPWCQRKLHSNNRRIPPHVNWGGKECSSGLTEKFATRLVALKAAAATPQRKRT